SAVIKRIGTSPCTRRSSCATSCPSCLGSCMSSTIKSGLSCAAASAAWRPLAALNTSYPSSSRALLTNWTISGSSSMTRTFDIICGTPPQPNSECCASRRLTADVYGPAMLRHNLLDVRQTDATAGQVFRHIAAALKSIEYALEVTGRNADPLVAHRHHCVFGVTIAFRAECEPDRAAVRAVFDRI